MFYIHSYGDKVCNILSTNIKYSPVVVNNHTRPHTEKCKYLGHTINNNLTDNDDVARQKRCIYAQTNVLSRNFYLCSSAIKTTLFNSSSGVMYASSLVELKKNQVMKGVTVIYNNSFILLHNLPPRCSASYMFATNHVKSFLTNAFAHQYLAFYAS